MFKEIFIAELDYESKATRNYLIRVTDESLSWKAHEKSMSIGELAIHIATLPFWGLTTLNSTYFDLSSPEAEALKKNKPENSFDILNLYDRNIALLKEELEKIDDESFSVFWSLRMNETVFFSQPRMIVLRNFFFNHLIHHRAQLGVFFRLKGIPVPATYGPSADEQL